MLTLVTVEKAIKWYWKKQMTGENIDSPSEHINKKSFGACTRVTAHAIISPVDERANAAFALRGHDTVCERYKGMG